MLSSGKWPIQICPKLRHNLLPPNIQMLLLIVVLDAINRLQRAIFVQMTGRYAKDARSS
jgi:hypothetical protein